MPIFPSWYDQNTSPATTDKILVADVSNSNKTEWSEIWNLPVSTATQSALDNKASIDPSWNLEITGALYQNETSARSWWLATRDAITTFPVPSFRPITTDSTIAVDVMPNGTPVEYWTNWLAWIDVVDTDMLSGNPAWAYARMWITGTYVEFGSKAHWWAIVKPVRISVGSTTWLWMDNTWKIAVWWNTTPNTIFDIVNNASWDSVFLWITDNWWTVWDRKRVIQTYSATTLLSSIDAFYTTWTWVDWRFSTYNSGRNEDVMVIRYDWRVWIWITNPLAKIHVESSIGNGAKIRISETWDTLSTQYAGLELFDWTTFKWWLFKSWDSHDISIWTTSERLRILASNWNVGIWETAPDYKLDVNGTFWFTPWTSVTPVDNWDVVFELTNNTTFTIRAKWSDWTVRSWTVTLT